MKSIISVSIDSELLKLAKERHIKLSSFFNESLKKNLIIFDENKNVSITCKCGAIFSRNALIKNNNKCPNCNKHIEVS